MVHAETEDLLRKKTNAMRAVSTWHMVLIALRCALSGWHSKIAGHSTATT